LVEGHFRRISRTTGQEGAPDLSFAISSAPLEEGAGRRFGARFPGGCRPEPVEGGAVLWEELRRADGIFARIKRREEPPLGIPQQRRLGRHGDGGLMEGGNGRQQEWHGGTSGLRSE
jgi:hypothetical protein